MEKKVGLWIDHKKAVVTIFDGEEEVIKKIESRAEKHIMAGGRVPAQTPYGRMNVSADDSRERHFSRHLTTYFDKVISSIGDAKNILVLGPGEAKGEFKKHFLRKAHPGKIVGVEPADKMTDRQLLVKTRDYFKTHKK